MIVHAKGRDSSSYDEVTSICEGAEAGICGEEKWGRSMHMWGGRGLKQASVGRNGAEACICGVGGG